MATITSIVPQKLRRKIKLALHKGQRFTCPLCGYNARDLRPTGHDFAVLTERQVVGGGLRPAGCYQCGSSDRERLIYLYLKEEIKFFESAATRRVLHIAPEKRLSKAMLQLKFEEYICGDLFTEGYHYPSHVQNINVMDIPAPNDHFDLVLCNHVLEHIETDDIAMSEINRVLKPGGFAILQVPLSKTSDKTFEDFTVTDPRQREQIFGQFDHVRIYGQDYPDRLRACGFRVERIDLASRYRKFGTNPDEELFICTK